MIRIAAAVIAALALCTAASAQPRVSYFPVPQGAHPHDVAAAPDGTVWYTAQHQGALGILDPRTGKVEQVPLGKGASPHGVIAGPDGAAWITETGLNAIARVDPKSKEVKLFPLPKGFEKCQSQHGGLRQERRPLVHRPEPASTDVSIRRAERSMPGRRRRVTGPMASPRRPPARSGTHRSAAITLPASTPQPAPRPWSIRRAPGVGPRRIWSDSKGVLWVSLWHAGEIGRYDPAANKWTTYPLPKSKSGCYSVYVDEQDKVWVTDFVANAILRFDPASEKFESFPSNKRAAAVRQMLGRAGRSLGRGVRHRPAGGGAVLGYLKRVPDQRMIARNAAGGASCAYCWRAACFLCVVVRGVGSGLADRARDHDRALRGRAGRSTPSAGSWRRR